MKNIMTTFNAMEQILKTLQEIHIKAFRMNVPTFYITTYHWGDTPESPDAIIVRASKSDQDDDTFCARFYRETNPQEAAASIHELKIYLGL